MLRPRGTWRVPCILIQFLLLITGPVPAAEPSEKDAQALIDSSIATLGQFLDEKGLEDFRNHLREAKGVIIVPRIVGAGLLIGGSRGKCTALARYGNTSKWSQP